MKCTDFSGIPGEKNKSQKRPNKVRNEIFCLLPNFTRIFFPEVCKKCQINQSCVKPVDSTGMSAALANWYSIYIPIKIFKFWIAEVLLTGAMPAAPLQHAECKIGA